MSKDYIELEVSCREKLTADQWKRVEDYVRSKGLDLEFRIPRRPPSVGVGPRPKATADEINQRIRNNLDKAVRDGDVEDARSWAGLLALLA